MENSTKDKLYQVCKEAVTDTEGNADDLYNILEGHTLQYLEEIKDM